MVIMPTMLSQRGQIAAWIAVNGCTSVLMTLANKQLSKIFPHPFTVINIQNGIVFLVSLIILRLQNKPLMRCLTLANLNVCKWVALATTLVLTTSIVALRYAPVPLIVTIRNLTPIVTSLLESFVLGSTFSRMAYVGLSFGLAGSLLYGLLDLPQKPAGAASDEPSFLRHEFGFAFVIFNMILSSLVSILERTTMDQLKATVTPVEVNCLRIVAMTPILTFFSVCFEDLVQIRDALRTEIVDLSTGQITGSGSPVLYLLLTGVVAAAFGISALSLTHLKLQPTTLAFLNITYKVFTTLFGSIVFPAAVKLTSWLGYGLALGGFVIYIRDVNSRRKEAPDKKEK